MLQSNRNKDLPQKQHNIRKALGLVLLRIYERVFMTGTLRDVTITLIKGTSIRTVSLGVCFPHVKIKTELFELV